MPLGDQQAQVAKAHRRTTAVMAQLRATMRDEHSFLVQVPLARLLRLKGTGLMSSQAVGMGHHEGRLRIAMDRACSWLNNNLILRGTVPQGLPPYPHRFRPPPVCKLHSNAVYVGAGSWRW